MKRRRSRGFLCVLGLVGCVLWTGCGGGGGGGAVAEVAQVSYVRTAEAPGIIRLSWTSSSNQSLLGYMLQRRVAGDQTFIPITPHAIASTSFTDVLPDSQDSRTLYYQVIAVGAGGKLSRPTEVTVIVAPPAPPGGF